MRYGTPLAAVLCLFFVFSSSAWANHVTDDQVRAIGSQLFCPVCLDSNITVDQSQTARAQEMRLEIRQQLEEGRTPKQILAYFADRYGPEILAAPQPRGIGWLAWLAPAIVFLSGAILLVWLLRRHLLARGQPLTTKESVGESPPSPELRGYL